MQTQTIQFGRIDVSYDSEVFIAHVNYNDGEGHDLYCGCKINSNDALDYRHEIIEDELRQIDLDLERRCHMVVMSTCDYKIIDGKIVSCEPYKCRKHTHPDLLSSDEKEFIISKFNDFLKIARHIPEPDEYDY